MGRQSGGAVSDVKTALHEREIRKATEKAEWYEQRGNHALAKQYRDYVLQLKEGR